MKVTVFMATCLDEFTACNDGDVDWLMKANKRLLEKNTDTTI